MAFKHFVTCVMRSGEVKTEENIWLIGGYAWRHSTEEAISYIEKGTYEYYVRKGNRIITLIVATINEKKYLRTEDEGDYRGVLLALPECD